MLTFCARDLLWPRCAFQLGRNVIYSIFAYILCNYWPLIIRHIYSLHVYYVSPGLYITISPSVTLHRAYIHGVKSDNHPPPSYCLLGPQADSQNDRYNAYARLSCALSLLNSRVLNKPLTCGVQALHTKRTYNINLPFYNAFTSCIRSGCYYSSAMK